MMDWIIGNLIPFTLDDVAFELWMKNGNTRKASRKPSLDYSNLFFDDCTHPSQNALCNNSDVMAWRLLDEKSPEATKRKSA